MLYVWGKAIFGQVVFYMLTIWIYAQTTVAISAGREVVEVKMLEKLKSKKREEPNANLEAIDEMELPSDEKSTMWKIAITSYTLGAPIVIAVPVMYALFWQKMIMGETCEFYSLATPSDPTLQQFSARELQKYCMEQYPTDPVSGEAFKDESGFRYTGFLFGLFFPAIILIVEFCLNQILLPKRQFFTQILFALGYLLATGAYTATGTFLFPGLVDASCNKNGDNDGCLWTDFFKFHLVFMGVTQASFWTLVFLHYIKVKVCCRKSVSIIQQPLFTESQVTITAKQR